jgi:sterol desaturase/sphingolipid hydroxylase (fatty acid hydroxylase superfamily)
VLSLFISLFDKDKKIYYTMIASKEFVEHYVSNPWLCWGLGPSLCASAGLIGTVAILEWLMCQKWMKRYYIKYSRNGDRSELVKQQHEKVSLSTEVKSLLVQAMGPVNIVACLVNPLIFGYVVGEPETVYPSAMEAILHLVAMLFLTDFFAYWIHRMQHENEWLWRTFHSRHHLITTPTAISTAIVHSGDAALGVALPLIFSGLIMKTHPITFSVLVFYATSDIVQLHSGLNCWWLRLLSLQAFFPLHVSICHHDSHHRFGNKSAGANNYGVITWGWDWAFGTLSQTDSWLASLSRK